MADDGGETPKKGGCCSKSPKKKEDMMATGKRSCTDVACCLFFLLFVGGLVAVAYLGLSSGDVSQLRYDADYLGNRCGVGEYANATKAFYPRIGKDLVEQNLSTMKNEKHPTLVADAANEKNVNFSFFAEIVGRCKKQIIGSGIKPGATTVPQVQGLKFVSDPAFQHLM